MMIGEFSRKVGLSIDTLRYYEKIGLMPDVDRTRSGRRRYGSDHIVWIDFLHVLKATGMGVGHMAEYVRLRSEGGQSVAQRQKMLIEHLETVSCRRRELQKTERLLRQKIDLFQSVIDGVIEGDSLTCAMEASNEQ